MNSDMKVIKNGIVYQIQPKTVGLLNSGLPVGTYFVRANDDIGYYLEEATDFKPIKEKVYGGREDVINRLFKSYAISERSLGVVLSGDKGIGKSLFARMAALKGYENGMPLIIIDKFYNGIAQFLQKIEQECIMLFDEFEKVFDDYQDTVLGLFDGVSPQKRMYIITANRVEDLNEFLVNRPGRFHYHLRFEYPTYDQISEYLGDNLSFGRDFIPQVGSLGYVQPLNYDTLRAIAFELNQGYTLSDSLSVLNILAQRREVSFEVKIIGASGREISAYGAGEYRLDGTLHVVDAYIYDKTDLATIRIRYEDVKLESQASADGYLMAKEDEIDNSVSFWVNPKNDSWESKGYSAAECAEITAEIEDYMNGQLMFKFLPAKTLHISL